MSNSLRAALLFWWFLCPWFSDPVIGPFKSHVDCERLRQEFMRDFRAYSLARTTSCWDDGRK